MDLPSSDDRYKLRVEGFDTAVHLAHAARQRDERKLQDVLIVDVDSHHYETESTGEIVEYFSDPVLQQLALSSGAKGRGRPGVITVQLGYQDVGGRIVRGALRALEQTPKDGVHREVHMSLKWMDAMGVDYACLLPTPMLGLALHPQPEVQAAVAWAYNKWLTERVLPNNGRIRSMLFLPLADHRAAYDIVRTLGHRPGVVGCMVSAAHQRPVYHNDYAKTFAAMEEMGLPLAFHSAYNWDLPMARTSDRFAALHATAYPMHAAVHLANWIVNGMPERFPRLRVAWFEAGVAWIPWMMMRLDNEYRMRSSEAPLLKRLPSEYMKDMAFSTQPLERPPETAYLEAMFDRIDAKNTLVYSSNYPHWDMDVPSVIWDLPFLDDAAKRRILGENARRLFNLDVGDRFPRRPAPR